MKPLMSKPRIIILVLVAVLSAAIFLLWWSQSEKVDMASYVPADALLYVEANSLTEIVQSVVSTDAWKQVAPAAGFESGSGNVGWLTHFAGWTGIGSHEAVVFARAQVAYCVLGFTLREAATPDMSGEIVPRHAVIVETHTASWRVRSMVENSAGRFARHSLGATQVKRTEEGEMTFFTWVSPADDRKRLVAAVYDSLAVIGNDEASVRACLAVKRGERPSLAGDQELKQMRLRMRSEGAIAFGYAPAGSAAKVAEVVALWVAKRTSENDKVQEVVARLLPMLAHRAIGSAGWAARLEGGAFVDAYFVRLPSSLTARLSGSIVAAEPPAKGATAYLNPSTDQLTFYKYRDPEAAWLALNVGLWTQVDNPLYEPLITLALNTQLEPYGVQSPMEFLRAAWPEIVTARLDKAGRSKVIIVGVRDREALREQIRKRLGDGARSEMLGDVELIVSSAPEEVAAGFSAEFLIMGLENDVRSCLSARADGRTLADSAPFKAAQPLGGDVTPHVRTVATDADAVSAFLLQSLRRPKRNKFDAAAFQTALSKLPYSVSESRITSEGLERRTRSSFGLFGTLVTMFGRRDGSDAQPKQEE